MSGGSAANESGKILESLVGHTLFHFCIGYDKPRSTGIYGLEDSEIVPDIRIQPLPEFPDGLYVECRRQITPGSAKDKMYKLLLNIKRFYDKPTIVVFDGEELATIRREFEGSLCERLVGSMWLSDFVAWAEVAREGGASRKLRAGEHAGQKNLFAIRA
jgi:hypothetical protein